MQLELRRQLLSLQLQYPIIKATLSGYKVVLPVTEDPQLNGSDGGVRPRIRSGIHDKAGNSNG